MKRCSGMPPLTRCVRGQAREETEALRAQMRGGAAQRGVGAGGALGGGADSDLGAWGAMVGEAVPGHAARAAGGVGADGAVQGKALLRLLERAWEEGREAAEQVCPPTRPLTAPPPHLPAEAPASPSSAAQRLAFQRKQVDEQLSRLLKARKRQESKACAPTLATSSCRPTERGREHAPGPALHAHQSAYLLEIGCFSALLPSPRTE